MTSQAIKLRPYQSGIVDVVRKEIRKGWKRICVVAPCGAGKTVVAGWMVGEAAKNGRRSVVIVRRNELIEQFSATFERFGVEPGIIASGVKADYSKPVQIASVQTLIRRLDKVAAPDIIICDECHHVLADSYLKTVNRWSDSLLIGMTATPERRGGVRLGDVFESLVEGPSAHELIEIGALARYEYYAAATLDVSRIRIKGGDYAQDEIGALMVERPLVGNIVEHYSEHGRGGSAICYCASIAHSMAVTAEFNKKGIAAAHCDGKTHKDERARLIKDFRSGEIRVLCNVDLFGEGLDVPGVSVVILARPTMSLTLYIQQAMRALRPSSENPEKRALIFDHVDNYKRHGLPDDIHSNSGKDTPHLYRWREELPLSLPFYIDFQ